MGQSLRGHDVEVKVNNMPSIMLLVLIVTE